MLFYRENSNLEVLMMAMYEGGCSATIPMISYDDTFAIRNKNHKENIAAILIASIDALDVIRVKTPFSIKKYCHFLKAKKKLSRFKEMNKDEYIDIYNLVNFFYFDFEEIETNQFSGRQKEFIYSLNNLMLKVKNDLIQNYEEFANQKFIPHDKNRKGYGGFYFE